MTENKRFKLLYSQLDNGMFVDREKQFEDIIVDKEFQKIGLIKLVDLLNKLADENEQLKQFIQSLAEQSVNGKVMLRDGKVYDLNEILKKGD